MESIPPTIPFHVAKAYGLGAQARVAPVRPIDPASIGAPVQAPSQPQITRPATDTTASQANVTPAVARLLAARVPGEIDFNAGTEPQQKTTNALPFYRHPADSNAAATAIGLGRALDTNA